MWRMSQNYVKETLITDYLKYMGYVNIPEEHKMCYLRPKGLNIVNYIEQLFLRLFDEDIEEYIDKHNLKMEDTG